MASGDEMPLPYTMLDKIRFITLILIKFYYYINNLIRSARRNDGECVCVCVYLYVRFFNVDKPFRRGFMFTGESAISVWPAVRLRQVTALPATYVCRPNYQTR